VNDESKGERESESERERERGDKYMTSAEQIFFTCSVQNALQNRKK